MRQKIRLNADRFASLVFAVGGVAWLAFKSEYLRMDIERSLKLLLVSPGVGLMIAASSTTFKGPWRRSMGALLMIGLVALFWSTQEPSWRSPRGSSPWIDLFIGYDPALTIVAATFVPVGLACLLHISLTGCLLLGASVWCFLCAVPSRIPEIMTRASRLYDAPTMAWAALDIVLPILLAVTGILLIAHGAKLSRVAPSNFEDEG